MKTILEFLSDPIVWYAIAIVLFFAIAYRLGGKAILAFIDGEIAKVRDSLAEAQKLRSQAEEQLASYEVKQKAAMAEAEEIVAHAKQEAARLKVEAEAELKESLARQEKRALDRVQQAEAQALSEVRVATVEMALAAARKMLAEKMDQKTAEKLVDEAIAEVPRLTKSRVA